ncbi:nucleolar protein 4 isoform X1 [Bombyx mandarina]|uniref:Nucleolar protein 4 helical domain-containing protein n=2 Tax=Bombyx TaxID=7090 RepID=A0A8R2GAG5_BOMMO|nr:nucleolar protein 4 isoform X2 [Bombyx mori]XP_028029422.1 nucleolar protein 4 isoform X1 [Bombyx mandarina]
MAAAMISDRGLRKKLTQDAIPEKTPRKPSKRKSTAGASKADKKNEQNNNKRPKVQTGDPKLDLFTTYQPWVIQTYGDQAKTKTITLKKYARILRTLRGEECNSSDSSKFRFWVKAKGFYVGKPPGYDAKPADSIVCRYSVVDAEGCTRGTEGHEVYSGSQNDPPLYIPTPPLKNAPNQEPVYRKVAIVENFFDIIYTVHVELEGRPGKHAGQKRTYRTITETYAFLPREAVTRFLTGCAECARRPRSASPPPLPTPSPSPTRHPTYLPYHPHCPPDYSRNWESEIDAAHSNYYEPKFEYTELQPVKKVESPKPAEVEEEPTYIELTTKKVDFDQNQPYSRSSPVEPAIEQDEPIRTDPEIDKDDNSLIDVEEVKPNDSPLLHKEENTKESEGENTSASETPSASEKTEKKKYNPLDVANLTSKDPPKCRSPSKFTGATLEYPVSFGRFARQWRPDGAMYYGGEDVEYGAPITTNYLKQSKNSSQQNGSDLEKDNLTPEPHDMNEEENFTSQALAKDAEKLKMMLLAWNYHNQSQGRNGEPDSGGESMADLWASYHSALGLGSKPPKAPTPMNTGHSSPIHVGSATPVEPASTHDETSSSDRTKDDDDGGASDDDSDDRVDPQHHDPERLKAFNMFVRLFVDENLDRIVPISKQPKEKIQAIIDSCTRQFPEFAERARKRIRTYLKSCRRNKKVRGDVPTSGSGNTPGSGSAWDSTVRPTPAHLTSVQAEHILAQACENESLNAKRMRLGLDPVSQPMPTVPTPMAIDSTATSAVASSFLSLYSGAISSPASTSATTTSTSSLAAAGHSKAAADTTRPSASPTMENALLNNNTLKVDNANGNTGSKTASPASSPAPLFRPTFPATFGTPQGFGRQNVNTTPASALSSSALLSTLTALPPSGVGVNAAMAAYQNALLSAMAAHTHTFPTNISAPTDLSLKSSVPAPLHVTSAPSLTGTTSSTQSKSQLFTHKLSGPEVGAVRQLITGYRESAAFLLRSADELETLLLNQP